MERLKHTLKAFGMIFILIITIILPAVVYGGYGVIATASVLAIISMNIEIAEKEHTQKEKENEF